MRKSQVERKTNETSIVAKINLDGTGVHKIDTGIGFFDHMLNLMAFHGKIDLELTCQGDLEVDTHHTMEDIGLALGKAYRDALGDRKGIQRYSHIYLPMDEVLVRLTVDISGRPYLVYDVPMERDYLGEVDTQNFEEFFRSFISEARITLHATLLYGRNDHHKIEAVFKALGRVLKEASICIGDEIMSTKGVL
jgi:imidazoleglycerol-phosphate dehydratase